MITSNETLRRLERLHVRAWPASETARIAGWLWRWSGGGSQRANSVSTVDFIGNDMAGALDQVEARYRAKDSPSQVHTFDLSLPRGLPALLAARGYVMGETTLTMLATAPIPDERFGMTPDVAVADDPDTEWLELYMAAVTASRRAVNRQILRRIADPRAFFSVRSGGRVISIALGVVDSGHAIAECVATRPDARGQRGADSAMRALMTWAVSLGAHTVGLQVVEQNQPALALYRRLGFQGGVYQPILAETAGCEPGHKTMTRRWPCATNRVQKIVEIFRLYRTPVTRLAEEVPDIRKLLPNPFQLSSAPHAAVRCRFEDQEGPERGRSPA